MDDFFQDDSLHEQIQNNQCPTFENKSLELLSKNKYIKKINQIISQGQLNLSQYNPQIQNIKSQDSSFPMNRKQRNKFSAKKSRDRKKMYIKILEQKKESLEKQLSDKKKQLKENQSYLKRINHQNRTMNQFTTIRHQMMKQLQRQLQQQTQNQNLQCVNINQIIDNLRSNIGGTGKQRVNLINEYFRYIIGLFLPALYRYMIWSASEETHLFENESQQNQNNQWSQELKNDLKLTKEQSIQIKQKRTSLQKKKIIFQQLMDEMKQLKGQMDIQSIQLERIIDGIRKILTPIQCARFILFIQKNKYRRQLNLLQQQQTSIRKIIKIDK